MSNADVSWRTITSALAISTGTARTSNVPRKPGTHFLSRHTPRGASARITRSNEFAVLLNSESGTAFLCSYRARNPNREMAGLLFFREYRAFCRATTAAGLQAGQYLALRQIAVNRIPHSKQTC